MFRIRYNIAMPVPAELLSQARRYSTSAAATLLESYYPLAHRIAYALCGDARLADVVIRDLMHRALLVLPKWQDETLPDRWFYHHTLLACRAIAGKQSSGSGPVRDTLVPAVASAPYLAFIRTLRSVPAQQREAIILSQGERLNARFLGVAMDCSGNAAAAHLQAATEALRQMTGDTLDSLLAELSHVYRALAPSVPAVAGLRGTVSRFIWPRLVWRRFLRIVVVILFALGAYGIWRFRYLIPMGTATRPA